MTEETRVRKIARAFGWDGDWLELRNAALCVAAVLTSVLLANEYSRLYHRNVVDDAMISMQYAKNVVLGHGVVFNPGERVEGYTNFLWLMLMVPVYALTHALHVAFVPVIVQVEIYVAAADVAMAYVLGRRIWGSNVLATALALGVLVLDNSWTTWAAFGLEGHFLAFWILLALLLVTSKLPRRGLFAGLALAGAQMTRPDAGLFCAVLVGSELLEVGVLRLRKRPPEERRAALVQTAWMLGAWVGVYGAYFAWRWHYYGYLLPNTFYLKVESSRFDAWKRGLQYVKTFFSDRAWIPAIGALALLKIDSRVVRALLVYAVLHSAYIAYVGGDFYPGQRFFVAQLPVFALCTGAALEGLWRIVRAPRVARVLGKIQLGPPVLAGAAAVLVIGVLDRQYAVGLENGPLRYEIQRFADDVSESKHLAEWVRDHHPPGAVLATGLIGHLGFIGDVRVVDLYGVIDPTVAHRDVKTLGRGKPGHEKKMSDADMLARKPTYIMWGYTRDDFWRDGYFFQDLPPHTSAPGIWERDSLPGRGRRVARIDFNAGSYDGWAASGDAFASWPSRRLPRGELRVVGVSGGFIDTFADDSGDDAKGQLVSAPFALVGDEMVLRVGGGDDPAELSVSLVVGDEIVRTATGRDSEFLSRRTWDIRPWRGQQAHLQIVDEATGHFGHIIVDQVEQWVLSPGKAASR